MIVLPLSRRHQALWHLGNKTLFFFLLSTARIMKQLRSSNLPEYCLILGNSDPHIAGYVSDEIYRAILTDNC